MAKLKWHSVERVPPPRPSRKIVTGKVSNAGYKNVAGHVTATTYKGSVMKYHVAQPNPPTQF